MLDLAFALLGVLVGRDQVQTRARHVVVSHNDLLARRVLGRDVLCVQLLQAVFSAPGQCSEQPGGGVGGVPFCGAQVAEKALACEPHALGGGDWGGGAVAGGGGGDGGP